MAIRAPRVTELVISPRAEEELRDIWRYIAVETRTLRTAFC